jgi:hypothetical protein
VLLPLLLLAACSSGDPTDSGDASTADNAGFLSRDDGWLRGDLHMHSTYSDGWDDVATVVALGTWLEDPTFLEFHPEYAENGLDYLAITDHRTVDAQGDPAWQSDRLVLLGGEEFGSSGHAGALGVHAFVDHDPGADGVTQADIDAGLEATHGQGGVFSPNHAFLSDISFPWEIRGHDAIEAWNSGWILMSPETTDESLKAWEAANGSASPLFRRAVQVRGQGSNQQALAWYEAQLSRGIHVALVGGSDRHAVLLPGFPTTWVRSASTDEAGILQGIRDRHTFVSRTPASAEIDVQVDADGETAEAGDDVAIPNAGTDVTLRVRVGRADGAVVRVIRGGAVASDEALATAELGAVAFEEDVVGADFLLEEQLAVVPGDWFYVVVSEPLYEAGLDQDEQSFVWDVATAAQATGADDFVSLAQLIGQMADPKVLGDASNCYPPDWQADQMQCATADTDGIASFFVPDRFDRALNATTTGGTLDGWSMGAIASAVRFVAD